MIIADIIFAWCSRAYQIIYWAIWDSKQMYVSESCVTQYIKRDRD